MDELPETLRTAVLLRDIRELSYQEIADTLHLPEGTVKSRINRGRTELARQIKRLKTQQQAESSRRARAAATAPQWSERMNLTTESTNGLAIVRVGETRLMYPMLADFSATVSALIARGEKKLSSIWRRSPTWTARPSAASWTSTARRPPRAGVLKLAGVQKRVETMLTMTGAHNFLQLHPDEASAVRSFEG